MKEQVERLLTEMGWESDGYLWSSPTRDSTGLTPVTVASDPGMDWVFDHAIPWATSKGWEVKVTRWQDADENVAVIVSTDDPEADPGFCEMVWDYTEPDQTCAAIIDALYQAVTQ